jgi:DNA-directed RNA polymerase specialized sigma24 family protein
MEPVGNSMAFVTCTAVSPPTTAGEEDFEGWYQREHPRLVGALMWVSGDVDAVRDAVDEACARALARWERTAIALRYVADLTEEQIAGAMGVRRSTVSVLLGRAHERLAALLADEPEAGES